MWRGGAETVDPQPPDVLARHAVRPVSDQSCAQQRSSFGILVDRRNRKAVALVGHGVLGVAAVEGVAGEPGAGAKVLLISPAVATLAAGVPQPRHADTVADLEERRRPRPVRPPCRRSRGRGSVGALEWEARGRRRASPCDTRRKRRRESGSALGPASAPARAPVAAADRARREPLPAWFPELSWVNRLIHGDSLPGWTTAARGPRPPATVATRARPALRPRNGPDVLPCR